MGLWNSDGELFRLTQQKLFTCEVRDVRERMGLTHYSLPSAIGLFTRT